MSELVRCQSSLNIIADFHPCQGLGFNCLHLYDPIRLVNITFAALRFVMNALVLWISIRCVKDSPIKYYTLNLLVACFICDTLLTIRECLLIVYLYRNFFATAVT
uniref:G_PROTEIN_RECEP_F1_2 domain-containing protein n=1 Tax=Ascaris lumbricoides TaxID=6252 RepID=A0A0M3IC26_ASCLU